MIQCTLHHPSRITFSTGVCPNHHPSIIHQSSITTVLNLLLPPQKKPVVFSSFASKSSWSRNKEILKWVLWASFKPGRDVTFVRWGRLAFGVIWWMRLKKTWGSQWPPENGRVMEPYIDFAFRFGNLSIRNHHYLRIWRLMPRGIEFVRFWDAALGPFFSRYIRNSRNFQKSGWTCPIEKARISGERNRN